MKKSFFLGIALWSFSTTAFALQFNVKGHDRIEVTMLNNIDAVAGGVGTSGYWNHRLYLQPSLLIDDHFTVFMEWKVLNYARSSTDAPNFGTLYGSNNGTPADIGNPTYNGLTGTNHHFGVSRAWIEWTSDWGLLRGGRAPRHWGLGMIYHSGDGYEYDYQYTEDLVQYLLPLGFITFSAGFGKIYEGDVSSDFDDSEDYFAYIHYDNPEVELNAGFMYNRAMRVATGGVKNNYHLINIFGLKEWSSMNLKVGGEFGYVFGSSSGNSSTGIGFLGTGEWRVGRFTTNALFGYATGDSNTGDQSNKDFRLFSQNIRPALIMFREDVAGVGSGSFDTVRASPAIGQMNRLGAIVFSVGETFRISNDISTSVDFTYGLTPVKATTGSRNLGFEIDAEAAYQIYQNFLATVNFGYMVTGNAFPSNGDVWAIFSKGVLTF